MNSWYLIYYFEMDDVLYPVHVRHANLNPALSLLIHTIVL